jgi:hypothetical protein
MKKTSTQGVVLALAVTFTLFTNSCQKEAQNNSTDVGSTKSRSSMLYEQDPAHADLEQYTAIIVEAMGEVSFRAELKEEALLQYADEYENERISNWRDEDHTPAAIYERAGLTKDLQVLQDYALSYPEYELSVPIEAEDWDEVNFAPLVVYLPSDYDENAFTDVKGYDQSNAAHWLPVWTDPTVAVVVLRERQTYKTYALVHGIHMKAQSVNYKTSFSQIGTDNISAIESWTEGPKVELRVETIASKSMAKSTDYFFPKRKEIKNSWKTVNHDIMNWDDTEDGGYLNQLWIEEDKGDPVTLSYSIKDDSAGPTITSTVSTTIQAKDDQLGQKSPEHADPTSTEYNTGKIKWKLGKTVIAPPATNCPYMGSYDGANCYIGSAPSGTSAFIYANNFYYTPVGASTCPYPGSWYDGANCFVANIHASADPFIYANNWYVQPGY